MALREVPVPRGGTLVSVPCAVPYLRVSTDDKGQDPLRQMAVIESWAKREGIRLILPPVIDEGTSADKTNPFERPAFLKAIAIARDYGAAIVTETGDRFTRRGTKLYFVYAYILENDHGVRMWEADQTIQQQESALGEILRAIKAMAAKEWIENHKARVKSGMAKRRASGAPMGRPPKPFMPGEAEYILQLRAEGKGWKTMTHALNKRRGVFELKDDRAVAKRKISSEWVRAAYKRLTLVSEISPPQKNTSEVIR